MADTQGDRAAPSTGGPDKKVATLDKPVTIVTTSGELKGNINLNFASVQVNRVSDLFIKSNIAFLPLYNGQADGQAEKNALINVKDIAVIIPHNDICPPSPELRKDCPVSVKLKFDIGQLIGKANLLGETQQMDRISDLLNFPGKKWLVLYEVSYKGRNLNAAIVNLDFISTVQD